MSKDFNNLKNSINLLPKSELGQDAGTSQEKYFRIFVAQYEDIDFTASQVRFLLDYSKQSGVNIDLVGQIVGVLRAGLSDADFIFLLDTLTIYGRPGNDNLVRTLKELAGVSDVELQNFYPASYSLAVEDPTFLFDDFQVRDIIQALTPSGIKFYLTYSPALADSFAFDPEGAGFGDSTVPATGGEFAGIL